MPTLASVPFENLLEPRGRDSLKNPFLNEHSDDPNRTNGAPRHLYISPALYATPEQAPIPEHPSSVPPSPSPYVVNLKRRRGGNERMRGAAAQASGNEEEGPFSLEEEDAVVGENSVSERLDAREDVDEEGFFDPRSEAVSVESEVEARDSSQMESRSFVSAQGDFFDAIDDFSSDGSISNMPSSDSRIESELRAAKLNILDEIGKRKAAEETLMLMRCQWERLGNLMSQAGLTCPAPPACDSMQLENNSVDQLLQEVVVTRFVAEAIGRGEACAEAEEAAAVIVEKKDQEICRLRDRLQYYETVNHELSQRKLVEVARRQQERKRSRRRWIWSFMGLSITLGASFLAYLYIPHASRYLSSTESVDLTDTSGASPTNPS